MIGKNPEEFGLWVKPQERQVFINLVKKKGTEENFEMDFRNKAGDIGHAIISAQIYELSG